MKKIIALLVIGFLVATIPVIVWFLQVRQTFVNKQRASGPSPTISLNLNPITRDAKSFTSGANINQLIWKHTTGAHDNRILLVSIGADASGGSIATTNPVTSVTYNGIALTKKIAHECALSRCDAEMWYLQNPPAGTYNVVVKLTKTGFAVAGGVTYYNVDPINPFDTTVANTGVGNHLTATINATGCNQMGVDIAAMDDDITKLTAGTAQTTLWSIGTTYNISGSSSMQIKGRGTFNWDASPLADEWVDIAVILNPLISSCTTPVPSLPPTTPTATPNPSITPSVSPTPINCVTPAAVKNVKISCPNCAD